MTARPAAQAALEALGVDAYLPHVFGYDSVAHPKPAPDIVHAFAQRPACRSKRSR